MKEIKINAFGSNKWEKDLLSVIFRLIEESNDSKITTNTMIPIPLLDDDINNRCYIWCSITVGEDAILINASIDGRILYDVNLPIAARKDGTYELVHSAISYECYWCTHNIRKLEKDDDTNNRLLELLSRAISLLEIELNSDYKYIRSIYFKEP